MKLKLKVNYTQIDRDLNRTKMHFWSKFVILASMGDKL